jgi:hypothetical protein
MSRDLSPADRQFVAERAYHVCEYCLVHQDDTFWGCQVDHIISRRHEGTSERENLAWACAICNNLKGTDLGALTGNPPKLTRLFHPRADRWAECFHLHLPLIEPLSAEGEATVRLLQFNEESRRRERVALAQAGRYPTVEALARMKE